MYNNTNIPLMAKISIMINTHTRHTAVLPFDPHTPVYLPFCRYCNASGKFEAGTSQVPSTTSIKSVT